ncbi:MAG: hypothetical protein K0R38_6273 [Polyangiaceae bacterium]|nr:hypothetical protein [Polyangiaceae bacterium]
MAIIPGEDVIRSNHLVNAASHDLQSGVGDLVPALRGVVLEIVEGYDEHGELETVSSRRRELSLRGLRSGTVDTYSARSVAWVSVVTSRCDRARSVGERAQRLL